MKKENNNVIKASLLTKKFGHVTAVDQATFGVGEGEIFGFLGPNGAGKTTTIRMLTGLLTSDLYKWYFYTLREPERKCEIVDLPVANYLSGCYI